MPEFAFIGGSRCGYKLMEAFIEKKMIPQFSIILKEDQHETEKYSDRISKLLSNNQIPNSIKKKLTESDYKKIAESNLDFIIVYGWRTLIDSKVINFLKFGIVAAHHSLLPKYRGFAPVQWAIINGEKESGVTLFLAGAGEVDSGKIIDQKKIPIGFEDYAVDLFEKLIKCAIEIYFEFFEKYKLNKIHLTGQDESSATYCCKRTPEDGRINWEKNSVEIYNFIRALTHPLTGAYCEYEGNFFHIRRAKLGDSNDKNYTGSVSGRVIKITDEGIEILCNRGTIFITEWENKKTGIVNCPSEQIKSVSTTLK